MKSYLTTITLLLFFATSYSQIQNPDWVYLSKSQPVSSMAFEGNEIWIGSGTGIVKFNKITNSKIFFDKTTCPIVENNVSSIAIDHSGTKWFGTWGSGLVKYNGATWINYDTSNSSIPSIYISGLTVDASNNLWVITPTSFGGLTKYDGITWTNYNMSNSGLPSNFIQSVYADGDTIWAGTNYGLAKFDGNSWTVYNTSNSNISNLNALRMEKDRIGNLWLLHYTGLEKFDGANFTMYPIASGMSSFSMTIDTNNLIWTGCSGSIGILGGIMSFDGSTWTKFDSTNSPLSDGYGIVLADSNNCIWIGCKGNGYLDKKNASYWNSYNISKSMLNNNNILAISVDYDGNAFIGSYESAYTGKALLEYNGTSFNPLGYYTSDAYALTTDKTINTYVKKYSGLYKYNGSVWSTIPGSPTLYIPTLYTPLQALATDTSGGVWMDYVAQITTVYDSSSGTTIPIIHEGLAHYDGNVWITYNYLNSPLPDANILSIKTDHNNNVWFSLSGYGLMKFDGSTWTNYTTSNSCLASNYISCFAIDLSGNIWYSDNHYGFNKFEGVTCTNYSHPTLGMYYSTTIKDMAVDIDESIWQTTTLSIIHFDGITWQTLFSKNSPLPSSQYSSLTIDRFGNKWIGTGSGVMIYKSNGVTVNIKPPGDKVAPSAFAFPNPFHDAFEIVLNKEYENIETIIYDLSGRIVYQSIKEKGQNLRVPRNDMHRGVYFYRVTSGKNIIATGKIVAD